MKRVLLLALAAGAAAVAWYQATSTPRPMAQLFPSGALVYLEAKDFARLLSEWNSSTVKQDWLSGANYAEFERSNLFLKLNGFYKSYGAAAGFTPDMVSLLSLAGDESALALYDLQHVQFAYITRLPESKVAQTRLWLGRRSFETRQSSGVTFFVNRAQGSAVAFARANGYLLVSTDEGRMAGMLGLLNGKETSNIAGEGWYKQSTEAAGAPGELRLAMNLENLVENTTFVPIGCSATFPTCGGSSPESRTSSVRRARSANSASSSNVLACPRNCRPLTRLLPRDCWFNSRPYRGSVSRLGEAARNRRCRPSREPDLQPASERRGHADLRAVRGPIY